jgi:hypothetical protein
LVTHWKSSQDCFVDCSIDCFIAAPSEQPE